MNQIYWLLNLCLLAAAGAAIFWVLGQGPEAHSAAGPLPATLDGSIAAPPEPGAVTAPGNERRQTVPPDQTAKLWRNTLFNPARTEEVGGTEKPEDPGKAKKKQSATFELQGIARIAGKSAAIIIERTTARPGKLPKPPGVRRSGKKAPKPPPEKKSQRIYEVGEQVGETGYIVKEIGFDSVVLSHGKEELTLDLQSGDDASSKRREAAAAADKKRRTESVAKVAPVPVKAAGAAKATTGLKPPPPPPPPIALHPGATIGTGTSAKPATTAARKATNEERMRRVREIRERMLERRRTSSREN